LAIQLGVGRVHDHHGRQVVDPEIIVVVVAQAAYRAEGLFLRRLAGHYAGFLEVLVISQHAAGGLHHVLCLLAFGLVEVTMDLLEHQQPKGQQHQHGDYQDQPETAADRHAAQTVHRPVTPCFL
jgi:hypothetical protein